jgi:hypothetical protein
LSTEGLGEDKEYQEDKGDKEDWKIGRLLERLIYYSLFPIPYSLLPIPQSLLAEELPG